MKTILLTLAALTASSAAQAQPAHDMTAMAPSAMAQDAEGVGVIRKLDAKAGSITLQHGPIAALRWPAMTMPFKAAPALLQGFKVGQKVSFTVRPGDSPEIVALKSAD